MSWKWQMNDNGTWISNSLRFATKEECERYGVNLSQRWFARIADVDNCRAVECVDLVTEGNERAFKPAVHQVQL
jgi:hypothetical protein